MIRFMGLVMVCVWASVAFGGGGNPKSAGKLGDGSWHIVKYVISGNEWPEKTKKLYNVVIKDDQFDLQDATKKKTVAGFKYKLDSTKTPMQIDMTATTGKLKGKISRGIYKMDKANVVICVPGRPDQPRPDEFTSGPGSGVLLLTLKKAAK